tara:strand:+ start:6972 stop:7517 length:546 start_codon:yes stop_codon:yes gene_type:complete
MNNMENEMDVNYDSDNVMNDDWIHEIEETEKNFLPFYNEENEEIEVVHAFINTKNEIQFCTKETIELNDGIISKEYLKSLIKKRRKQNKIKYKVISLLQYNIDLTPSDVDHYIQKPENYNFFSKKKKITDIKWNDSINFFKSLNTLYILYRELDKANNKLTRKKSRKNTSTLNHNKTIKRT